MASPYMRRWKRQEGNQDIHALVPLARLFQPLSFKKKGRRVHRLVPGSRLKGGCSLSLYIYLSLLKSRVHLLSSNRYYHSLGAAFGGYQSQVTHSYLPGRFAIFTGRGTLLVSRIPLLNDLYCYIKYSID